MTMPVLINKIQNKQLGTAFKAAFSILSQGVMNLRQEEGGDLRAIYTIYDQSTGKYPKADEFYEKFYKYSKLKVIGECNYKNKTLNYNKSAQANVLYSGSTEPEKALANGMCFEVTINGYYIILTVDINGAKRPNLLGHDIFFFYIDENDILKPFEQTRHYTDDELENGNIEYPEIAGYPCSIYSNQSANGFGCAHYAVIDKNPDDETKGYWESLP